MDTRMETCNFCDAVLAVPIHCRSISCPVCNTLLVSAIRTGSRPVNFGSTAVRRSNTRPFRPGAASPPLTQGQRQSQLPWVPQQLSPPSFYGGKRAVLCGVSYYGQKGSLKGSVNDVRMMRSLLVEKLGFPTDSVLLLSEEEREAGLIPTKANIRKAMSWLVSGCQSGSSLVFHYSGHGSQVKDSDGDEADGVDECLVPVDYSLEGKIVDDEINSTIVRPLPAGAKLHAIIDTCRSGTFLDLPFVCRLSRNMEEYRWEDHRRNAYKGTWGGKAISISACDDHQTSGDTTVFTGEAGGALTYSFVNLVQNQPNSLTYGSLLACMRRSIFEAQKRLRFNNPDAPLKAQEPQLSSTEKFNIYAEPFCM